MPFKRTVSAVVVVLVLGAIAFLSIRIYQDASARHATTERIQTLPPITLTALDGTPVSTNHLATTEPVVLVYFGTTCRFCQAEAHSLAAHDALQDTARIFMISAESRAALEQFAAEYELDPASGIQVLRDRDGTFAETFGISRVPNTFIYGANRRLLRHFQGEASAEAIRHILTERSSSPTHTSSQDGCVAQQFPSSNGDCSIQ